MVSSPTDRNLYRVLGLSATATDGEIRAAYVQLARVLHPDRYQAGSEAEQNLAGRRMREVNGAWEVLGKSDKRAAYDAELKYQMLSHSRPPQVREHFEAPAAGAPDEEDFDRDPFEERPEDMVLVPAYQAFLLRRLPVIVAIAIAVAIFIGTAYASTKHDPTPSTPTTLACNSSLRPGCERESGG